MNNLKQIKQIDILREASNALHDKRNELKSNSTADYMLKIAYDRISDEIESEIVRMIFAGEYLD